VAADEGIASHAASAQNRLAARSVGASTTRAICSSSLALRGHGCSLLLLLLQGSLGLPLLLRLEPSKILTIARHGIDGKLTRLATRNSHSTVRRGGVKVLEDLSIAWILGAVPCVGDAVEEKRDHASGHHASGKLTRRSAGEEESLFESL
jgi:hypothetical protein